MARRPGRRRRAGFTLVELMATVAVIGLAAGAVLVTAAPPQPPVTATAERLAMRLAEARAEAVLSGRAVAVTIDEDGYRFAVRQGREWTPAPRPFAPVTWEEGVISPGAPQRWTFDATGSVEPGRRALYREGRALSVGVDETGQVRVEGTGRGDG